LVTGNAGDHKLVHALLRAANQAPSYDDFITWLDEPSYEPTDRLLVKLGSQIIAHVQVLDRVAWFDGVRLPVGGVQDLATLPEYNGAGYERLLLSAAEQTMRDSQAVVAFGRTDRPDVFRNCGWSEVRNQRFTEANVSDILARLSPAAAIRSRRGRLLRIRLWRQIELDALREVYREATTTAWGALDRSEPYWRWLVSRKAHDELIVAVHGRDEWEEIDRPAHIVGYAVTRGSQVVELCIVPGFAKAAAWRLLARACQDAIEQDHRTLSLHTPPTDPLHELILSAGGSWSASGRAGGGTLMVKLLDPARWVEAMYPVLLCRAKATGVKRPLRVVFGTGRRKYQLELTRRSSRFVRDDAGAVDVRCEPDMLAAMLIGNLEIAAAGAAGPFEKCDAKTAQHLAALFPPSTFWQSQFDLLRF
jgi:predicted acetyltransferase